MVKMIRREMPKLGTRKLVFMLKPFMYEHNVKMGRDALHSLLQRHSLIIISKKRYAITTNSNHWYRKYKNLIIGFNAKESEELWVSDITYISTINGFNYLSLITDAYSKKIVGHCLYETLESIGCVIALEMAIENRKKDTSIIHHSDRGIQYCSNSYVSILKREFIQISMTETSSPYDNAIAERVNGILKSEFGLDKTFSNHSEAEQVVDTVISVYNNKRPHASCNYLTPEQAETEYGDLKKRWTKKEKIVQINEDLLCQLGDCNNSEKNNIKRHV